MIQASPILGMSGSVASAVRTAISTTGRTLGGVLAGALVSFASHAANCAAPPASGKIYNIVNEGSGLYLDVARESKDNGADIIQWAPNGKANQQWTLTKVGDDAWTLRAVHSQKSLDLSNWRTDAGAPFKQWATSGTNTNQLFFLRGASGGAVNIVSRHSWQFVTADASNARSGVYQDYDRSAGGQRWFLNPVDGSCSSSSTGKWGSFMGSDRILIGGLIDESTPDHPSPDTINKAPWDLRYTYIHSPTAPYAACYAKCDVGCKKTNIQDGGWWGCYKMSDDGRYNTVPGTYITDANEKNANGFKPIDGKPHRLIQQWTWYSGEDLGRMQLRLNQKAGSKSTDNDYRGAIRNQTLLKSYFDDYRFLLKKIGNEKNIIQLEPDFWGFLRNATGNDPHAEAAWAPVKNAAGDDCKLEEDRVAGIAGCLISMTRKYAPNAAVGLHFSCWDNGTPEKKQACVDYWKALGAGKGDFLASDVKDRDAAWAEINQPWNGKSYWWDDKAFADFLTMIKMMTEGMGVPMILWQIPLGNENQWNVKDHWKDNKVKYLFENMEELAKAHVVALQFGAGYGEQTSTTTDGGYLLKYAQDYYKKGGVRLK